MIPPLINRSQSESITDSDGQFTTSMSGDPGWTPGNTGLGEEPLDKPPIMAVCTDGSRCGCAIYANSSVNLVADRKDPGDPYKGLDIIIQRINPEVVVVSAVQKRLITFLEKRFKFDVLDISKREHKRSSDGSRETANLAISLVEGNLGRSTQFANQNIDGQQHTYCRDAQGQAVQILDVDSDIGESNFILAIVPNLWFSISQGFHKLLESELVKSKGFNDIEEKSLFITSKVDRSVDVCALRAISALDKYLKHTFISEPNIEISHAQNTNQSQSNNRLLRNLQNFSQEASMVAEMAPNLMPILEIRYIDPGPVLSMDKFTLESLGIFYTSDRYSSVSSDPNSEAIPSLYEILNQCQSIQGKKQLKTIMLWPIQDINELQNRYGVLEFFMNNENRLLRDQISMQLKNIVPLSHILTKLANVVGTHREFMTIYKALWAFLAIIDLIKAHPGHGLEILNRIEALDSQNLRDVVDSIMNIVDFEASRREKRIQVCLGVDESVDEKKEIVKNLAKFCDEVAIQETAKYKDVLRAACKVLYVPRIGFLNSIDYTSTTELMQIRSNSEFDVLLHTEQSVYFKTRRMEELDNNAGDIACDLIDVQESVVINLQNEILKHAETALRLLELCGELDCLIAFSLVSFQRGYVRPDIVPSDGEIDIKKAYHPLYCIRTNIVPNDVRFYKDNSQRITKVMVITGPNLCGKTTFMKATCLVVYMAHIGCFVPALAAKIPVVDAILTRIHSANSISTGLSSFANDIHQINYALARSTPKSLIAVDEFGKGTHAQDGFQLLKGLVTFFATRIQASPFVMISTHYSRLVNHLQNYSEFILYKTFKVSRDPSNDNIIYEYKVLDGVGEISLADKVAAKAGVPQHIITRASQVRDCMASGAAIRARPPFAA